MSKKTATHSATVCLAVTPSDSTDLTYSTCRAIYIGGDGNISLVDGNAATIVFTGVTAGLDSASSNGANQCDRHDCNIHYRALLKCLAIPVLALASGLH
jgi:hypothetical protein